MSRQKMRKEVTSTKVLASKIAMVDGEPQAQKLPEIVLMGNKSIEQAQKFVSKEHGTGVQVLQVNPETRIYEMDVLDFTEVATDITEQVEENRKNENE